MKFSELTVEIVKKQSFLCIGLDSDINKIPEFLMKFDDPVFEFNKQIIDATHDLAIAYKPNIAFYESRGVAGWKSLESTVSYLNDNYPDILLIADAKRGDIGNTSKEYAKAFFSQMDFDAITVAPYMGRDSVEPFLEFKDRWVIVLGLTSNLGAFDFQFNWLAEDNAYLYEKVISETIKWGTKENTMFVVGATKAEHLKRIRKLIPDHFLLVPGVGVQGGSLDEVVRNGMNKNCGLIVNSSRGIIFAGNGQNFAEDARLKTLELQQQMSGLLKKYL
ncbi:MAG: orotidine-5'-phosphate decarboxylase [Bacteroidetes bacterium]|nr:MAG: orotidine-5'-phosphate decarboxylase [Bacteroidota bacterium]